MAGPMTAGALKATELRPIALPTYWRSTSNGTQLWRTGESNALAAEFTAESTTRPARFKECAVASSASASAASAIVVLVTNKTRRRGS